MAYCRLQEKMENQGIPSYPKGCLGKNKKLWLFGDPKCLRSKASQLPGRIGPGIIKGRIGIELHPFSGPSEVTGFSRSHGFFSYHKFLWFCSWLRPWIIWCPLSFHSSEVKKVSKWLAKAGEQAMSISQLTLFSCLLLLLLPKGCFVAISLRHTPPHTWTFPVLPWKRTKWGLC